MSQHIPSAMVKGGSFGAAVATKMEDPFPMQEAPKVEFTKCLRVYLQTLSERIHEENALIDTVFDLPLKLKEPINILKDEDPDAPVDLMQLKYILLERMPTISVGELSLLMIDALLSPLPLSIDDARVSSIGAKTIGTGEQLNSTLAERAIVLARRIGQGVQKDSELSSASLFELLKLVEESELFCKSENDKECMADWCSAAVANFLAVIDVNVRIPFIAELKGRLLIARKSPLISCFSEQLERLYTPPVISAKQAVKLANFRNPKSIERAVGALVAQNNADVKLWEDFFLEKVNKCASQDVKRHAVLQWFEQAVKAYEKVDVSEDDLKEATPLWKSKTLWNFFSGFLFPHKGGSKGQQQLLPQVVALFVNDRKGGQAPNGQIQAVQDGAQIRDTSPKMNFFSAVLECLGNSSTNKGQASLYRKVFLEASRSSKRSEVLRRHCVYLSEHPHLINSLDFAMDIFPILKKSLKTLEGRVGVIDLLNFYLKFKDEGLVVLKSCLILEELLTTDNIFKSSLDVNKLDQVPPNSGHSGEKIDYLNLIHRVYPALPFVLASLENSKHASPIKIANFLSNCPLLKTDYEAADQTPNDAVDIRNKGQSPMELSAAVLGNRRFLADWSLRFALQGLRKAVSDVKSPEIVKKKNLEMIADVLTKSLPYCDKELFRQFKENELSEFSKNLNKVNISQVPLFGSMALRDIELTINDKQDVLCLIPAYWNKINEDPVLSKAFSERIIEQSFSDFIELKLDKEEMEKEIGMLLEAMMTPVRIEIVGDKLIKTKQPVITLILDKVHRIIRSGVEPIVPLVQAITHVMIQPKFKEYNQENSLYENRVVIPLLEMGLSEWNKSMNRGIGPAVGPAIVPQGEFVLPFKEEALAEFIEALLEQMLNKDEWAWLKDTLNSKDEQFNEFLKAYARKVSGDETQQLSSLTLKLDQLLSETIKDKPGKKKPEEPSAQENFDKRLASFQKTLKATWIDSDTSDEMKIQSWNLFVSNYVDLIEKVYSSSDKNNFAAMKPLVDGMNGLFSELLSYLDTYNFNDLVDAVERGELEIVNFTRLNNAVKMCTMASDLLFDSVAKYPAAADAYADHLLKLLPTVTRMNNVPGSEKQRLVGRMLSFGAGNIDLLKRNPSYYKPFLYLCFNAVTPGIDPLKKFREKMEKTQDGYVMLPIEEKLTMPSDNSKAEYAENIRKTLEHLTAYLIKNDREKGAMFAAILIGYMWNSLMRFEENLVVFIEATLSLMEIAQSLDSDLLAAEGFFSELQQPVLLFFQNRKKPFTCSSLEAFTASADSAKQDKFRLFLSKMGKVTIKHFERCNNTLNKAVLFALVYNFSQKCAEYQLLKDVKQEILNGNSSLSAIEWKTLVSQYDTLSLEKQINVKKTENFISLISQE